MTKTEIINIAIGAGQLLIALLILLGIDKKIVSAKLAERMAPRSWLIILLIIGGWAFTGYAISLARTRAGQLGTFQEPIIYGRTYRNETIDIDGKIFDHCIFENVTFFFPW